MIIKIIPEGDIEKRKIKTVEHKGVKEFFIFGNKKEDDGDLIDFHDWSGGYRYLMGSLAYFNSVIENEMITKNSRSDTNEISLKPPRPQQPPKDAQNVVPFIKRGEPKEQNIEPVVLAEDVNEIVEINPTKPIVDERDTPTVEIVEENEQAGEDK